MGEKKTRLQQIDAGQCDPSATGSDVQYATMRLAIQL